MKTIAGIRIIMLLSMLPFWGNAQDFNLREPIRFLALGDSYTIGESVPEEENWPTLLFGELKSHGYETKEYQIIAKTGWRADQLIQAITDQNPENFNLVSLLIGVNNQYQNRPISDMKRDFECLLREAVSRAGNNKQAVFVVSIPDYAYTPFGQSLDNQNISEELNEYNAWQKARTNAAGIAYIDITEISRLGLKQPNLVAADGLHPSGDQYRLWVAAILEELLGGGQ